LPVKSHSVKVLKNGDEIKIGGTILRYEQIL